MDDIKAWIAILVFLVLPVLQRIAQKMGERRAAQARAAGGRAPADRPAEVEEETLPDWLDPRAWEVVEDEERAAPPPLAELHPEVSVGPALAEERRGAAARPTRPAELGTPVPGRRVPIPRRAPAPARTATALPAELPSLPGLSKREDVLGSAAERAGPSLLETTPPAKSSISSGGPRRNLPTGRSDLQSAVIWSEVLGKPRALRPQGLDEGTG